MSFRAEIGQDPEWTTFSLLEAELREAPSNNARLKAHIAELERESKNSARAESAEAARLRREMEDPKAENRELEDRIRVMGGVD